jgi:copper oxidase (laccase) domain-containing protein
VTFRAAGEHLAIDLPGGTALFTTRRGGVSEGPYASLNLGLWTDDDPGCVQLNRDRVQAQAGASRLAQGRQVHGTRVVVDAQGVEEADGQVTTARGVAAAAIGPGIGPCCYEVGDDVRAVFGTSEPTLDLKAIARARLEAAGVGEVHDCGLCTSCDAERFFSHRRDRGVTGRQAGLAWRS